MLVGLLLSLPAVLRIPTMDVSSGQVGHSPLIWAPPVWFLGVNRWLLEESPGGYASVARLALISSILILGVILIVLLFVFPGGLAGAAALIRSRLARRRRAHA